MTEVIKSTNPANAAGTELSNAPGVTARNRIPLSGSRAKLKVPDIPGYHTHWFLDTPARVQAALLAGYEYVNKSETSVPNHSVAGDRADTQGTDMGSRVTIIAGGDVDSGGQAVRLVLLKLRQEWRDADMQAREENSDRLVAALRNGTAGDRAGGDPTRRYGKPENRNIFTKRKS